MAAGAPHIAILSSPGVGHLVPVAELAKRLVLRHNATVSLITFADFSSPAQASLLASLPSGLSSISLPHIPLPDLPADAKVETRIAALIAASVAHVTTILLTLNSTTTPLAAYIADIFAVDTLIDAAPELHIPRFLFLTSNFMFTALMLHLPDLHATTTCAYRDLPDPVRLPGCPPVAGPDLLHPMRDRNDDAYRSVVHLAERYHDVDGIIVNSFHELEPAAAAALAAGKPPAYPVGPLIRAASDAVSEEEHHCMQWLDKQPTGSVVYVSFGSGGTMSSVQTAELAAGLETSGQRFLWVVRKPSDIDAGGGYLEGGGGGDAGGVRDWLPEGFVERTSEVGMVVPAWAPQVEVLQHRATAGFVSHCGWNSTMESVVAGVPMVAWPMYAEQRMNAVLLAEGVGVALRVQLAGREDGGVVEREEIARLVRELMIGEGGMTVRKRVTELQAAATAALGEEGSSYKALDELVTTWKDCVGI